MYTVEIGRQFLKFYNQKTGNDYSALDFFEEEFFPVVFDSEDYLHLMHVTNSPFFQNISKKEKENDLRKSINRKNRFLNKINNVIEGKKELSGSIAVGYMAGDLTKSTTGQISSIDFGISEKKILYSWIGGALGIGFGGGKDFLIKNNEINWFLFQGWEFYRKYLDNTPKFKGRQLETWNGLWINYGLKSAKNVDKAFEKVSAGINNHTKKSGKNLELGRPEWIKQVFALARYFDGKKEKQLMYGYGYGQMNTTLGFLNLQLGEVNYMADLFDQLIAHDPELKYSEKANIEDAYQTFFSLQQACAMGGIGVQALRPKDLRKYTTWTKNKNVKTLKSNKKEADRIKFYNYITWIQAMLQNDETLQLSEEVAEALIKYENLKKRTTERKNAVKDLWDTYNRQQLIEKMSDILADEPKIANTLNRAVDELMTEIPQDMYKLFLSLVKFKYNFQKSN